MYMLCLHYIDVGVHAYVYGTNDIMYLHACGIYATLVFMYVLKLGWNCGVSYYTYIMLVGIGVVLFSYGYGLLAHLSVYKLVEWEVRVVCLKVLVDLILGRLLIFGGYIDRYN